MKKGITLLQNNKKIYADYLSDFEAFLKDMMSRRENTCHNQAKVIIEAMNYSLFAGGKRLRPLLALLTCDLLNGNFNEVLPFACAIEMIHTYSLIHDDLPEMDNDDLRRGKPTSHIKFGQAIAVLAGDSLLNLAFEILSEELINNACKKRIARAMSAVAEASGYRGMIGGQVMDILHSGTGETLLEDMHRLKTGALIKASVLSSAYVCGANKNQINSLTGFAQELGLAFQIRDDILDVAGSKDKTGKSHASDEKSGKTTYVTIYGIGGAQNLLHIKTQKAGAYLKAFGENAQKLLSLANELENREF